MPEILIKNVPVHFPFEPYDVQRVYMEKVIECLQAGAHGMLESPTGTGKTLSLLCSSLAWLTLKKAQFQATRMTSSGVDDSCLANKLENDLNNVVGAKLGSVPGQEDYNNMWKKPKIIYASRTHSQLTQAISELKRTNYAHMRMAVIGSRDQLCVHPEVSQEQESAVLRAMCQAVVKSKKCSYYGLIEKKRDHPSIVEAGVMDIEDLTKVCKKLHICPYFMSRELKQQADIIFMPYNYILDARFRKQQDIELGNSIVILDEGHNVEKICEDSASQALSSTDIAICLSEVTAVMNIFSDDRTLKELCGDMDGPEKDFSVDDLMSVKSMFLALETAIDNIRLTENKNTEVTYPGEYIFELLEKATITNTTYPKFFLIIDKIIQYLNTVASNSPFKRNGSALDRFLHFLDVVFNFEKKTFSDHYKDVQDCYRIFVTHEKPKNVKRHDSWLSVVDSEGKPGGKIVNFWCFNPGFGMKNLLNLGIHSIILTSGTLSPLGPLISELGIPINITLENGHVIGPDQVFVSVVREGPDRVCLNSTFKNRSTDEYISSIGRTIVNFARVVPEGLLVFFPSYTVMNNCKDHWESSGIWSQICASKEIFVEPQGKREFNEVMTGYYSRIAAPGSKGACFLAVCRGKVSEGLDFADHNGRAVILTGLPFPPFFDPRVVLKKEYLNKNKKKVTGNIWYQLEATRAVNQAVGRVIRHKNDYAAILFCDSRFGEYNTQRQFPAWVRPYVQNSLQFGAVTRGLCQFFKKAKEKLPQPTSKSLPSAWADNTLDEPSVSKAVPASFDSTGWLRNLAPSREGNFNWNNAQPLVSSSLAASYSQDLGASHENRQPGSMFGALEQSTTVIDFNHLDNPMDKGSVTFAETVNESNLDPEIFQPNKRKKLQVMGVTLRYESEPLSENTSENSSENSSEKKKLFAAYLIQVKQSLSTVEFQLFNETVRAYSKHSIFSQLVQSLESLFSRPDQISLFQGFECFIKKCHKEEFNEYCKKKFALS